MSWPYIQSSMQNVRVIDGGGIEYPFLSKGDTVTKVYRMVCEQLADYYDPAQVALNTPMSGAAAAGVIALPFTPDLYAYFVGDTNHSHETGGMIRFERVFANIPQNTSMPVGGELYTFPGLAGDPLATGIEIDDIVSVSAVPNTNGIYVNFASPHGRVVGETVYCAFSYTIEWPPVGQWTSVDNNIYTPYNFAKILSATNTQIRVDVGNFYGKQVTLTYVDGSIFHSAVRKRNPLIASSTVIETTNFALPGVTPGISSFNDIKTEVPFTPIDYTTGATTDTLSGTTSPTAIDYSEWISGAAGDIKNLVIDSTMQRWMGNIFKITTRQIVAQ